MRIDNLDTQIPHDLPQPQHARPGIWRVEIHADGGQAPAARQFQGFALRRGGNRHGMALLAKPARLIQDTKFQSAQVRAREGVQDLHENLEVREARTARRRLATRSARGGNTNEKVVGQRRAAGERFAKAKAVAQGQWT